MAAKQGLSAQISQASEDAKRAVLNRTSLTTSLWFSNLNTTCTIKSAPPRTPEVLSLLSTKSGWLFKRNEQHVWQTRWCCVVPHTFLYYFDANVLPGEAQPPVPSTALQDDWNQAVNNGYPHRGTKKSAPRSSLYFLPSGHGGGDNNHHDGPEGCTSPAHAIQPPTGGPLPPTNESFATMQPAGIIDLECYTSVHRSNQNQLVLELAGDDAVNPDLRQFYFSAGNEEETEAWTQALLGQRHTALMDETDAYKQVCDGFAQQLQVLHVEMDQAMKQAEDAQEELYRVRCEMEDGRRSCWKNVEEVLDRQNQQAMANDPNNAGASSAFRSELDAIRSQDTSLLAPVQLLSDYTRVLEDTCTELQNENKTLQEKLTNDRTSDHDQVQKLQEELEETKEELMQHQSQWTHEKQILQQKVDNSTKTIEDLNKELASTRMEVTMYQSSTRNKITELQNHKKILKKEVIDLRTKLEEALSHLSLVKHKQKSKQLEVEQERKKAELLERYVDKMESQVKVQQNMMEMMSAAGSVHGGPGSVYGGLGGGSVYGGLGGGSHFEVTVPNNALSPNSYHGSKNVVLLNTPGDDKAALNLQDDEVSGLHMPSVGGGGKSAGNELGGGHAHHYPSPMLRRGAVDDSDNKSHMSELTEDRTQRQFDALQYLRDTRELREIEIKDGRPSASNARILKYSSQTPSPRAPTPPTYILGGGGDNPSSKYSSSIQHQHQQQLLQNFQNPENAKLQTISSTATVHSTPGKSLPPENLPRPSRNNESQILGMADDSGMTTGVNNSSSRSLGAGTPGRLSVAQRARLNADRAGNNPVKIRLDDNAATKQILEQQQQKQKQQQEPSPGTTASYGTPVSQSPARIGPRQERRPSTSSRSAAGSGAGFFSSIGRKLEAAIDKSVFSVDVQVRSDDESSVDGSLSDDQSVGSRRPHDAILAERDDASGETRYSQKPPVALSRATLDGVDSPTLQKAIAPKSPVRYFSQPSGSQPVSPRRNSHAFSDEKKTPTPDRMMKRSLSLKERQELQRAKQLQFLKDQGLIKENANDDAGSVTSTHLSSGPGSSPGRSLSSRLLRS